MVWFADNFNRADESLGASADWTERAGDHNVVSNRVQNNTAVRTLSHIGTGPISGADYYVKCTVNLASSGSFVGAGGRRTNGTGTESTYYACYVRQSANTAYIYYVNDGTHNLIDSAAFTLSLSTDYVLQLNINGTTISLDIDATTDVCTGTDSNISGSGDACMQMAGSGAATTNIWDDFEVDTLAAAANRNYDIFYKTLLSNQSL